MSHSDGLQRFVFERTAIRGEWVHLDATHRAILERHDYPPVIRELLGEALVAAALLSATIKYRGSLTLQVQGDGPVSLVVVQASAERTLRGLSHWSGDVEPAPLATLFGQGRLAITIDPGEGAERYQGIVSLTGDTLAQSIETYFHQSEQLPTRLWLAARGEHAAGMLVQHLPGADEDPDAWNRVTQLAATVTGKELLDLPLEVLIHRLFHEEDVRVFDAEPLSFRCSCSRERIANMLRALGPTEVRDILEEQGQITVHCEFCNHRYDFDAVDVDQLFAPHTSPPPSKTRH